MNDRVKVVWLGVLFFVVGIIFGIIAYFTVKSDRSLHNDLWIKVRGDVISFSLDLSGFQGWSKEVHCEYFYEMNGILYRSDRVSIGATSEDEYRKIEKRKRGVEIPVWVNAKNPSISVLVDPKERDYSGSVLVCSIALSMFVGAFACWVVAAYEDRNSSYKVLNIVAEQ